MIWIIERFYCGRRWKTHTYRSQKSFDQWWNSHLAHHQSSEAISRGLGYTGKDAQCAMRGYKIDQNGKILVKKYR